MKQALVINNKSYQFNFTLKSVGNLPLIESIESIGIHIANFCYNQELSIAGNCRMCFVEAKNALKPLISCAINLKSYLNSEIFTESPLIFKSRENILEFLLINHPIDCMVCDQAGECDLQDHSLIHGVANKRFYKYKRNVDDKYVGPILITSMTKCIHCTRCVRFCSEIAGLKELGIFGRGVFSEIGIYKLNGQLTSELSGNLIDLCPVGSITKKRYSTHTDGHKPDNNKQMYLQKLKNLIKKVRRLLKTKKRKLFFQKIFEDLAIFFLYYIIRSVYLISQIPDIWLQFLIYTGFLP
jgi:NADH dehydrogenase/NADH:ubiquinone oxidoreductase subunit G